MEAAEQQNQALRLFVAMDRVRRAWLKVDPCEGVTKSQFATLLVLLHGGKPPFMGGPALPPPEPPGQRPVMTLSAIADTLRQTMPAVSQRISRLEAMGYVERVDAPGPDKRMTGLRLSVQGLALVQQTRAGMNQRLDAMMAQISPGEMETLFRMLDRLAGALEAQHGASAR